MLINIKIGGVKYRVSTKYAYALFNASYFSAYFPHMKDTEAK